MCFFLKTFIVLLVASFSLPAMSADEAKRSRLYLSTVVGNQTGIKFLTHFRYTEGIHIPIFNALDPDSVQRGFYGFSLGYIRGLGDPETSHFLFSLYVEMNYSRAFKFPEAQEKEEYQGYVDPEIKIIEHTQTNRRVSVLDVTGGVVLKPFRDFPLGFDLGLGIGRFNQLVYSDVRNFT